jgi:hypothetical protein
VAANIGLVDSSEIGIGVFAYSPFHARHSPGKLFLLMLAEVAGQNGLQSIDLTPSGDYKDRLADRTERVHMLRLFGSHRLAVIDRLRSKAWTVMRDQFRSFPSLENRLRQVLQSPKTPGAAPGHVYCLDLARAPRSDATGEVQLDHIPDLFDRFERGSMKRRAFLWESLRRFEDGWRLYSSASGASRAWLVNLEGEMVPRRLQRLVAGHLAAVFDDFKGDEQFASLLFTQARGHGCATGLVVVDPRDHRSRSALEFCGARLLEENPGSRD